MLFVEQTLESSLSILMTELAYNSKLGSILTRSSLEYVNKV